MLKISALNEEPDEDEENEEEVTKEALEEIALQQYAKGLELQKRGRSGDAVKLLTELLDTELLDSIKKPDTGDKSKSPLLNLKYLCYKNIAIILNELGNSEGSIRAYLNAADLDDSDVTLWLRFGKVCLSVKKYRFACDCFRKGVERNSKFWPCLDNLITVLYALRENTECISYIYDALALDPEYLRGRLYRKKIFSDVPHLQEFLASVNPIYRWNPKLDEDLDDEACKKLLEEAATLQESYVREIENVFYERLPILTLKKRIEEFSWLSLGEALVHMYDYITEENFSHACAVNINLPKNIEENEVASDQFSEENNYKKSIAKVFDIEMKQANGDKLESLKREKHEPTDLRIETVESKTVDIKLQTSGVFDESNYSASPESIILNSNYQLSERGDFDNIENTKQNQSENETPQISENIVKENDKLQFNSILSVSKIDLKCDELNIRDIQNAEVIKKTTEEEPCDSENVSTKEILESDKLDENNKETDEPDKENLESKEQLKDSSDSGEPIKESNKDNVESSNADKEINDKGNGKVKEATKKIVTRRRGSSLSFLEQWEWCTKRRSSRKKGSNRNERQDENINDTMKRLLPQFLSSESKEKLLCTNELYKIFANTLTNKTNFLPDPEKAYGLYFGTKIEENDVQTFIKKYIGSNCDITTMLNEFVETLSIKWDFVWPEKLGEIFIKANNCAKQHYDGPISYDDDERLKSFIKINLCHLEIFVNKLIEQTVSKELPDIELLDLMKMLCSRRGAFKDEGLMITLRYLWVRCHSFLVLQNSESALDCLYYLLNEFDETDDSFVLHIPNFRKKSIINREKCLELISYLEQNRRLSTVVSLYESHRYENALLILSESFEHCQMQASKHDWSEMVLDWAAHLVILLESLWYLERNEECFTWSLIILHEALECYFSSPSESLDREKWSLTILKILMSIEYIVQEENANCIDILPRDVLATFINDIVRVIIHQYDEKFDEIPINTVCPWIILHFILQRLEDSGKLRKKSSEESIDQQDIPASVLILFIGHECLGKKSWCFVNDGKLLYFILDTIVPRLKSPALASVIEVVGQHLEQTVNCLFGHPVKKNKLKYLVDHNVTAVKLDWKYSQILFELYKPYELPEFNSYRLGSITNETEQLLQKVLTIMPQEYRVDSHYSDVLAFIEGKNEELPKITIGMPFKMREIYYLLADFYFKNNELIKALKFYALDVVICNDRFDSWAGMALARSSLLETKINSCEPFKSELEYLNRSAMVEKCFKKAIEIDSSQSMLWVEYGAFVYGVHSFCSRTLKQASESLSMDSFEALESRKENMLKNASKCFLAAHKKWMTECETEDKPQDERWLHFYMLGKVSEKNCEPPEKYLDHYITAGKFLQENNACYPNKISYNNPQFLSVEALEIHYRIHASILKYMEQHENKPIYMRDGKAIKNALNYCANGPYSQKRKQAKEPNKEPESETPTEISEKVASPSKRPASGFLEDGIEIKKMKMDSEKNDQIIGKRLNTNDHSVLSENVTDLEMTSTEVQKESEVRRTSQESTTTNTITSRDSSSDSSSESSSDDSSSDSSSDSSDSTIIEPEQLATMEMGSEEIANIVSTCVEGLEDCVSRFSQHYKALYRLAHFYFYYKDNKNPKKCRDIMLGSFTATNGNKLPGLFCERKNSNFFSTIWRIPSSEIDRPGCFASHMSRCVLITIEILKEIDDYKTLLDLSLQLQKNPDAEKKYLRDAERLELSSQALSLCVRSLKSHLSKFYNQPNIMHNPNEKHNFTLFTIDVYRIYQRMQKGTNSNKSQSFQSVLIDCYKLWHAGENKINSSNILEMSIKHSQMLINTMKNQAKETISSMTPDQAHRKSSKSSIEIHKLISASTKAVGNIVEITSCKTSNIPSAVSNTPVTSPPISCSLNIMPVTNPIGTVNASPAKHSLSITSVTSAKTTVSSSIINTSPAINSSTTSSILSNSIIPYLSSMLDPNLLSVYGNIESAYASMQQSVLSYASNIAAANMVNPSQYQSDLIKQLIETSYIPNIPPSYNQSKTKIDSNIPKMKDLLKSLQIPSNSYSGKNYSQKNTNVSMNKRTTSGNLITSQNIPLHGVGSHSRSNQSFPSSLLGRSFNATSASTVKCGRNQTNYSQMKLPVSTNPVFSSPQGFSSKNMSSYSSTSKSSSSIITSSKLNKLNFSDINKISQSNYSNFQKGNTSNTQMSHSQPVSSYGTQAVHSQSSVISKSSHLSQPRTQQTVYSSTQTVSSNLNATIQERHKYATVCRSSDSSLHRSTQSSHFPSGKIPSSLTITKTNTNFTKPEPSKVTPSSSQSDIIILDDD